SGGEHPPGNIGREVVMTHVAEHPATAAPTSGTPRGWLIGGLAVLAIVAITAGVLAFVALSEDTSEPTASVSVSGAPADTGLSGEEMSLFVGEPASVRMDPAVGLANGVLTAEEVALFVGADPEVFLDRHASGGDTGLTAEEVRLFITGRQTSAASDTAPPMGGELTMEEIRLFFGDNPPQYTIARFSG
ncbi:MAG: hypothetical protein QNJ71_11460, partial [Acidimicrobiia bacterium]|nr:hypothetical protein [Acidimicrobiia bacterium]